jgi:transcriptional regulator with XRE-family HTH domain
MEIGTYIKEARLKKGLTQEELAFQTDISVRTIQRIESGEVDPRSYTLQSIAKVLEIDFEHLFNFDKELATQKNDPREKNLDIPTSFKWNLCFYYSAFNYLVMERCEKS